MRSLIIVLLSEFFGKPYDALLSFFYDIVYVEWESRVSFVTIFDDLYQNKLWGMLYVTIHPSGFCVWTE